jgi:hypothetical protein
MSISAEDWTALGERAVAMGTTRTELIRRAIERAVNDREYDDIVRELKQAQRQLAAIRAVLGNALELTDSQPGVAA